MLSKHLITLYQKDLSLLRDEIEKYPSEDKLWIVTEGISNSAGNLAIHIVGGLNHFIGTILGNTGYVRQRDLEFSLKDVPREKILDDIVQTSQMVSDVISQISDFEDDYPHEFLGQRPKISSMLLHLYGHLNYHLGQVNYHRRLLTS